MCAGLEAATGSWTACWWSNCTPPPPPDKKKDSRFLVSINCQDRSEVSRASAPLGWNVACLDLLQVQCRLLQGRWVRECKNTMVLSYQKIHFRTVLANPVSGFYHFLLQLLFHDNPCALGARRGQGLLHWHPIYIYFTVCIENVTVWVENLCQKFRSPATSTFLTSFSSTTLVRV